MKIATHRVGFSKNNDKYTVNICKIYKCKLWRQAIK